MPVAGEVIMNSPVPGAGTVGPITGVAPKLMKFGPTDAIPSRPRATVLARDGMAANAPTAMAANRKLNRNVYSPWPKKMRTGARLLIPHRSLRSREHFGQLASVLHHMRARGY